MRLLIFGAGGMLGHKLWQVCRDRFDTWVTVRSGYCDYAAYNLFDPKRVLERTDALHFDTVLRALAAAKPQVVVNCIGIVKQAPERNDSIANLSVNALFPHRLKSVCQAMGARLIHISTDCVFSGDRGKYVEDDTPDATDLYGRTKFLGEVNGRDCLTLRTSIIGRELRASHGLVEWFLGQRGGRVQGYTKAIYTGLTTLTLARIIADVVEQHSALGGLYHVSSEPLTKYDLLCLLREMFRAAIEIEPHAGVRVDRSLDSGKFRATTGFLPPAWPQMLGQLADDAAPYELWRRRSAC